MGLDKAKKDEEYKLREWETNPPPVRVEEHKQFARDNIQEINREIKQIDEILEDVLKDLHINLKKNYEELRKSIGALCGKDGEDDDELEKKYRAMVDECIPKIDGWYEKWI